MIVMNLDKLEVWVRAEDFALAVYRGVVPHLPSDERWNLSQQLKRAAQSIPANIAESIGKQLNNYIAYLKRSKQGEKDIPSGYTVREGPEPYALDNPDEASID